MKHLRLEFTKSIRNRNHFKTITQFHRTLEISNFIQSGFSWEKQNLILILTTTVKMEKFQN